MTEKRMRHAIAQVAALVISTFSVGAIAAENACERQMKQASAKYEVPLGVLYAVGLTESGRKDSLQPLALNIEGRPYFATSVADGVREFEQARKSGAKLIDIGCMQINHHFHGTEFASVEAMFEPRANVDYAARFLKALRRQEGTWTLAVARYHAGPNNNPAQKKYVCAVILNMVASGFGNWTEPAREFCN
jgi:soluble lytic murein transglycosylase-like protein